jgi:serine/threonine protein kinase
MGVNLEEFNYKKKDIKDVIPSASKEAQEVMKEMIKMDPEKRPSAKELLDKTIFRNAMSLKQLAELRKEKQQHS